MLGTERGPRRSGSFIVIMPVRVRDAIGHDQSNPDIPCSMEINRETLAFCSSVRHADASKLAQKRSLRRAKALLRKAEHTSRSSRTGSSGTSKWSERDYHIRSAGLNSSFSDLFSEWRCLPANHECQPTQAKDVFPTACAIGALAFDSYKRYVGNEARTGSMPVLCS